MKFFRIIMILIGAIGVADTAVLSMWSNMNLGIMLPAIIGAPRIIVGIFLNRCVHSRRTRFGSDMRSSARI